MTPCLTYRISSIHSRYPKISFKYSSCNFCSRTRTSNKFSNKVQPQIHFKIRINNNFKIMLLLNLMKDHLLKVNHKISFQLFRIYRTIRFYSRRSFLRVEWLATKEFLLNNNLILLLLCLTTILNLPVLL